jgi:type II restriction enzyme
MTAIHHLFLTPDVVEERRPLSATARRAGWIGCNIRLDRLASDARIEIISSGVIKDRESVRCAFKRYGNLEKIPAFKRGWATLTLRSIRELRQEVFDLNDIYRKEEEFARIYPDNRHIRPKIRQQLQLLRDLGYLEFLGAGKYRILV